MATVENVLPVLNEERVLERSVRTLHTFLEAEVAHSWRITIADNGSTDATLTIAKKLSRDLARVGVGHIAEAGRGRALSQAWLDSEADFLAYMDIDLSTDLSPFPTLVDAIAIHGYDVSTGTRLGAGAEPHRSLKNEVLSRGFVFTLFGTRLRNTQCGLKAMSRDAAGRLVLLIQDTGWFWDTELLLLAANGDWRVCFVPVQWEDADSRVRIARTVWRDLKGLARMRPFDWNRAQKRHRIERAPVGVYGLSLETQPQDVANLARGGSDGN